MNSGKIRIPVYNLKDPRIQYLENVKKREINPTHKLLQRIAIQVYKYFVNNKVPGGV